MWDYSEPDFIYCVDYVQLFPHCDYKLFVAWHESNTASWAVCTEPSECVMFILPMYPWTAEWS